MNDILTWIQNWYKSNCNEDWEHQYGVRIDTLDNPGWSVEIDLKETPFENKVKEYGEDNSEQDWYFCSIKDSKYTAAGDPDKLKLLLELFRKLIEED